MVIFPIAINPNYNVRIVPPHNYIPFYFGECSIHSLCMQGILQNILLTIPFGFGINFLVQIKPGNILWLALAAGLGLELSQLLITLSFNSGFRAFDINDILLNATGVMLGYVLFRAFSWVTARTKVNLVKY